MRDDQVGVDLLDLLAVLPAPMGGRDRPRSAAENGLYALAALFFPFLMFVLVLFGGLWAHPEASLALAGAFLVGTIMAARLLHVGAAEALNAVIACAFSCLICGGTAFLLAVFASFYAGF